MSLLGRVELLHYGRCRKKCQREADLTRRFSAQAHSPKEEHEMKFYNQHHEFYCGIDLHANSMHVCVVDHDGKKRLHRNFSTKNTDRFLAARRSLRHQRSDHWLRIDVQLVLAGRSLPPTENAIPTWPRALS